VAGTFGTGPKRGGDGLNVRPRLHLFALHIDSLAGVSRVGQDPAANVMDLSQEDAGSPQESPTFAQRVQTGVSVPGGSKGEIHSSP
jgi:hypothetical protein